MSKDQIPHSAFRILNSTNIVIAIFVGALVCLLGASSLSAYTPITDCIVGIDETQDLDGDGKNEWIIGNEWTCGVIPGEMRNDNRTYLGVWQIYSKHAGAEPVLGPSNAEATCDSRGRMGCGGTYSIWPFSGTVCIKLREAGDCGSQGSCGAEEDSPYPGAYNLKTRLSGVLLWEWEIGVANIIVPKGQADYLVIQQTDMGWFADQASGDGWGWLSFRGGSSDSDDRYHLGTSGTDDLVTNLSANTWTNFNYANEKYICIYDTNEDVLGGAAFGKHEGGATPKKMSIWNDTSNTYTTFRMMSNPVSGGTVRWLVTMPTAERNKIAGSTTYTGYWDTIGVNETSSLLVATPVETPEYATVKFYAKSDGTSNVKVLTGYGGHELASATVTGEGEYSASVTAWNLAKTRRMHESEPIVLKNTGPDILYLRKDGSGNRAVKIEAEEFCGKIDQWIATVREPENKGKPDPNFYSDPIVQVSSLTADKTSVYSGQPIRVDFTASYPCCGGTCTGRSGVSLQKVRIGDYSFCSSGCDETLPTLNPEGGGDYYFTVNAPAKTGYQDLYVEVKYLETYGYGHKSNYINFPPPEIVDVKLYEPGGITPVEWAKGETWYDLYVKATDANGYGDINWTYDMFVYGPNSTQKPTGDPPDNRTGYVHYNATDYFFHREGGDTTWYSKEQEGQNNLNNCDYAFIEHMDCVNSTESTSGTQWEAAGYLTARQRIKFSTSAESNPAGGSTWKIEGYARDSVDTGPWSDIFEFRMDNAAPPQPQMDSEPPLTPGVQNNVSWDSVIDAGVGGVQYWCQCADNDAFSPVFAETGWTTDTSHTFTGLTSGTKYWYRVKAKDAFDNETIGWSTLVFSEQAADITPSSFTLEVSTSSSFNDASGLRGFYRNKTSADTGTSGVDFKVWTGTVTLERTDAQVNFPSDFVPGGGINADYWTAEWVGSVLTTGTAGDYEFCLDSDDGGFIFVNNTTVLWDPTLHGMGTQRCGTINLAANTWYPIHVGFFEHGSGAGAMLYWTPAGGGNAVIPAANLKHGLITKSGLEVSEYTVAAAEALSDGTTYYWRVRTVAGSGNHSPWSSTWNSTIDISPPPIPTMTGEPTFTAGTSNTVSWNAVTDGGCGGEKYYAEYATADAPSPGAAFSAPLGSSGWITGTSYQFTGLADGQIYYYHVKSKDAFGHEDNYSGSVSSTQDATLPDAWNFLTTGWQTTQTPDCQVNVSDGTSGLDVSGVFDWRNPSAWSSSAGIVWNEAENALEVTSYRNVYLTSLIPIDTSKGYYLEYDIKQTNREDKISYSGTHSYATIGGDWLPGHPGSYDYFCDCGDSFTEGVWYHRKNNNIGGAPRTGESSTTSDVDKWHTGTKYATIMFLFNHSGTSSQKTYIKNLKFYCEDPGTASGLAEYSTDGGTSWNKLAASCTGTDGITEAQTITASSVPFNQDSGTNNLIKFSITDMAGNSATSPNYTVKCDTTPPTKPGTPFTSTPTNDQTPTWSWGASEDITSGLCTTDTYKICWATTDTMPFDCTNDASTDTNSYTHTGDLAEGTWYTKVWAYDNVNHESTPSDTGSVVIDITAPSADTPTASTPPDDPTPTWTWAASTDPSGIAGYYIKVGTSVGGYDVVGGVDGEWIGNVTEFTHTDPLTDGTYYCTLRAEDNAGNVGDWGTSGSVEIITNAAPTATVPGSISQYSDGSGYVSFQTTIDDAENNTCQLKVEYSDNNGANWYDPWLVSVSGTDTPDLDNANPYQISNISTSTANTLTIVWDTKSASNGNYGYSPYLESSDLSNVKIRVTPYDATVDGDIQTSAPFEVDNLAPTVVIIDPLTGMRVNGDAVISFTDNELTAAQCSINDTDWVACTSDVTTLSQVTGFGALLEDAFTLYLKDTDPAGNTGTDSEVGIIKDTVAPSIVSVVFQDGDGYTNAAEAASGLNIVVTTSGVENGQTVTCYIKDVDQVHSVGPVTGDITTNEVTIASGDLTGLDDGVITITCNVSDQAGNPAPQGSDTSDKDTGAPTAPTAITFTASGGTVVSDYVNLTNTNFTGGATITAEQATGGYAEWLIDDNPFSTPIKDEAIASADTTVSFDAVLSSNAAVQAQISAGDHTLKVKLCDPAGNCTTSTASKSITADYVAPTLPTISIDEGDYTNTTSIGLTLSATGASHMWIDEDVVDDAVTKEWITYATSAAVTVTTGDALKTVTVKYKDTAGNETDTVSDTITLDTQKPTVSVSVSPDPAKAGTVTISLTFNEPMDQSVDPAVTFGLADPYETRSVTGAYSDETYWSGSGTVAASDEGTNTVKVTSAQDLAGKVMDADTSKTFVIDTTTPPKPTMPAEPYYTKGTANTVSWSAVDDKNCPNCSGLKDYKVQRATDSGFMAGLADSGWIADTSYPFPGLTDTKYWYHVKARDNAGNESAWSDEVFSTQDSTVPSPPPTLSLPADGTSTELTKPTFEWEE